MRIGAESVLGDAPGLSVAEAGGLRIAHRGFAFEPGHAPGPSIERFAARVSAEGPGAAAGALRGVYVLAVEDPVREATFLFVDPSGLYQAFWSPAGAAASFLALARASGRTPDELDPGAAVELMLQGHVAFGRTPLPSIRRIAAGEIVSLRWDGTPPASLAKPLPPLGTPPERGLLGQLERLAPALAGARLSLDLTGGADTRLLAVALAHLGVGYETVTAGEPGGEEVTRARRVARALGAEHHLVRQRPEALSGELDELLIGADCLVDPLLSQRELQMQRDRATRGIDLVMSGVGGELFSDHYWLQDFPRYRAPQADIERLWRVRFQRAHARPLPLAGPFAAAAAALPGSAVRRLEAYRSATNTQTYDQIVYRVRYPDVGGRSLTNRSRVIPSIAPMTDIDAARAAYRLPRRLRFFNGFHRRLITRLSPAVARLPSTAGGTTLSSAPSALPLDLARWTANMGSRALQKTLPAPRRRAAIDSPLPPLYRELRRMPVLGASVARLVDAGVLAPGTTPGELADSHLGGVIALARLLDELG